MFHSDIHVLLLLFHWDLNLTSFYINVKLNFLLFRIMICILPGGFFFESKLSKQGVRQLQYVTITILFRRT